MRSPAVVPALALVAGAACGALADLAGIPFALGGAALALTAAASWRAPRTCVAASAAAFLACGAALGTSARAAALTTPLRTLLDARIGGFAIDTLGPPAVSNPIPTRLVLVEDAFDAGEITTLRARVTSLQLDGAWHPAVGHVIVSVGGGAATRTPAAWVAGRTIELPLTFRRPARFLNDGVPDFERDLALGGVTLFASAKSGLLVEPVADGTRLDEAAAAVRTYVRRASATWVGAHDPLSAAIVTAVLIGDRTGLPDNVRERLQAAGTYHVIAISGGNVAILAALCLVLLRLTGVSGRPAAAVSLLALLAYAQVVTAGPSVRRATTMAVLYLAARMFDHRTPSWNALAITAAFVACLDPLDVRDVGFLLTFGATVALLDVAGRMQGSMHRRAVRWAIGSVAASLAVEAALLPIAAHSFSRVTSAGLLLNLVAVPLMGAVQVAGIALSVFDGVPALASPAGTVAHLASRALVDSARIVDVVPWVSARVPPPPLAAVIVYYVALVAAIIGRRILRVAGIMLLVPAAAAIVGIVSWPSHAAVGPEAVRLTMFDIGQSEAMLMQAGEQTVLVDTGGSPFGGGLDIGARVLAPALWARGVRRLDALVVTHGDPDHIGGARSVLTDFRPRIVFDGIRVPRHAPSLELFAAAAAHGLDTRSLSRGAAFTLGRARIRVLHPPPPDWERARVRNDDSIVLEVRHGDVAFLLTGDISAAVERDILPFLTPARARILKVAHHGSRTSTSRALVDGWRPHIALISAGRGNTFGHPTPDVLQRLEDAGASVYRTDRHGQITVDSNGRSVQVRTYTGEGR